MAGPIAEAAVQITPNFTGFSSAVQAGITKALGEAQAAIQSAFGVIDEAAVASGEQIGSIFAGAGAVIGEEMTAGADAAITALDAIPAGATLSADAIASAFAPVSAEIAASFDALAAEVDAAFAGLAGGAGAAMAEIPVEADAAAGETAGAFASALGAIESGFVTLAATAGEAASGIAVEMEAATASVTGLLSGITGAVGGIKGLAAAAGLGFGLKLAGDLQQTQVAFTGLFQSANTASIFIQELRDFVAKTPFQFRDITQASQQLIALGHSGTEAIGILKDIGNAAAAVGAHGDAFQRVVQAMSLIEARGKLSARQLLQIQTALPNVTQVAIFNEMSKATGKTTDELHKLADTGDLVSSVAIPGIVAALQHVPGAEGALERQSKTLLGVFSTLKDEIIFATQDALQPLATSISTTVLPSIGDLTGLLERGLTPLGQGLADAFGGLVAAFGNLAPFAVVAADAIGAILSAVGALAGPISSVVATGFLPLAGAVEVAAGALKAIAGPLASLLSLGPVKVLLEGIVLAIVGVKVASAAAAAMEFLGTAMLTAASSATVEAIGLGALDTALLTTGEVALTAGEGIAAALGPVGIIIAGAAALFNILKPAATDAEKSTNLFVKALEGAADKSVEEVNRIIAAQIALTKVDLGKQGGEVPLADTLAKAGITAKQFAETVMSRAGVKGAVDQIAVLGPAAVAAGAISEKALGGINGAAGDLAFNYKGATKEAADFENGQAALGVKSDAVKAALAGQADALKNLLTVGNAALTAEDALTKAKDTQKTATDAQKKAERDLTDLRTQQSEAHAKGLASAEKALQSAKEKVTATTISQADAQKALDDLLKPATERTLADAADAVTAAQIGQERQTLSVAAANQALVDAQKKATAAADALAKAQAGGATGDRLTALTKAQADAQTGLKTAQLDVAQSTLDTHKANEGLTDAQKLLNDAQTKGKVETPAIVTARQALAAATQAATDAVNLQKDAQVALNKAQEPDPAFAKRVADAETTLEKAKASAVKATDAVRTAGELAGTAFDVLSGKISAAEGDFENLLTKVRAGDLPAALKEQFDKAFPEAQKQTLVDAVLSQTGVILPKVITDEAQIEAAFRLHKTPFTQETLTQVVDKIFTAMLTSPLGAVDIKKILHDLGVPGFQHGAILDRPTLGMLAERPGMRELAVPIEGTSSAASLVERSGLLGLIAPHLSQAAIAEILGHQLGTRRSVSIGHGGSSSHPDLDPKEFARAIRDELAPYFEQASGPTINVQSVVPDAEVLATKIANRMAARARR